MITKKCILYLVLFTAAAGFYNTVNAQQDAEIKGLKIEVAVDAITFLQFNSSIPNFDWDEKDAYTIRKRGKDALIVSANTEAPKNSKLIVTEGGRTHSFLLVFMPEYDPNTVSLEHDFRDLKLLKELAKKAALSANTETEPPPTKPDTKRNNKEEEEKLKRQKEEERIKQDETATNMINETYMAALVKADNFFSNGDFSRAKSKYYEALGIKPNETYPKSQITKIDRKANEIKEQQSTAELEKKAQESDVKLKYKIKIDAANQALKNQSYYAARLAYSDALKLQPSDSYASSKIDEIDSILSDIAAKELSEKNKAEKQNELNNKYKTAIAAADKALIASKFDIAKSGYYTAAGLKPDEDYPKEKLAEIEKTIADIAEKNASNQARANEKIVNDKYTATIARADKAFKTNDYPAAKKAYAEAAQIKPEEAYAKAQSEIIDAKIQDAALQLAQERDKIFKEKKLTEDYNKIISEADQALASKNFDAAKTSYYSAMEIKPDADYPKKKLAAIEQAIVAEAVKANEAAESQRLKKYESFLLVADKAFGENNYSAATAAYKQALSVIPDKAYPQKQLFIIDKIENDQALREQQAQERERDKKVANFVSTGHAAFAARNFNDAAIAYKAALAINPNETTAKKQMEVLNSSTAVEMVLKKDLLEKYNKTVDLADKTFAQKDYDKAKNLYESALSIRPNEMYPKSKLSDIYKEIEAIEQAKKAALLEEKYKITIARADNALSANKIDEAKVAYYEAQGIKPNEKYAAEKLAEIENKLAEKQQKVAQEQLLASKYNAAIKAADTALALNMLEEAKASYQAALEINPQEAYPKAKLAGINKVMNTVNAKPEQPVETSEAPKPTEIASTNIKKGKTVVVNKTATSSIQPQGILVLPLKVQKQAIPYSQPELFKKYSTKYVFGDVPRGQRTTSDYFFATDTLKCWQYSQEVLQKEQNVYISDSVEKVSVILQNISFNGANTYFKFLIRNFSPDDFLTGTTTLSWYKKDGTALYLLPCYITRFPIVKSGYEMTLVYVARSANASNKDLFSFEINDRPQTRKFEIVFSGEIYNQIMSQ